jgi:hypothetical protein
MAIFAINIRMIKLLRINACSTDREKWDAFEIFGKTEVKKPIGRT